MSNVTFDKENMRLYCEHDFKSKLLRLRQMYLEKGLKAHKVKEIMANSIIPFVTSFRNMLRTRGKVPPVLKEDILMATASCYNINLGIFLKVLHHKKGLKKINTNQVEGLWPIYLDGLNQLALAMDKMK